MHKEGAGTFTRLWLPALAWLTSRAWLVVAGLVPLSWYPAGTLVFDDIEVYVRWLPSIAAGELPVDEMWQYPPAAAIVFAIGLIGSTPTAVLVGAFVFVDLLLTVVLYRHSSTAGWFWIASGATHLFLFISWLVLGCFWGRPPVSAYLGVGFGLFLGLPSGTC